MKTIWNKFKENPLLSFLIFLLVLAFGAFVGVLLSECAEKYISKLLGLSDKNEALKFLGISMGGILIALQALMSYRRAKAMEGTAESQAKATEEQAKANQHTEEGQRQERLRNAIEHLGHDKESVRLGGAYELFHLAEDTEDLRQTVFDILCAHIRQTTGESKYREAHKSKPSEEDPKPVEVAVRAGARGFQRSPHRLAGKLAERGRSQGSPSRRGGPNRGAP